MRLVDDPSMIFLACNPQLRLWLNARLFPRKNAFEMGQVDGLAYLQERKQQTPMFPDMRDAGRVILRQSLSCIPRTASKHKFP